jgi:CRP/FNR family cyclic AMP-dependent transcriptional regulator
MSGKRVQLWEHGTEAVVGTMEAGQFFGEGCLKGHSVWVATTVTLEECVITSITTVAMPATFGQKRQSEG